MLRYQLVCTTFEVVSHCSRQLLSLPGVSHKMFIFSFEKKLSHLCNMLLVQIYGAPLAQHASEDEWFVSLFFVEPTLEYSVLQLHVSDGLAHCRQMVYDERAENLEELDCWSLIFQPFIHSELCALLIHPCEVLCWTHGLRDLPSTVSSTVERTSFILERT